MWQKKVIVGLLAVTVGLMAGCGGSEKKAEAPKKDAPKILHIATNATYVPFEFKDKQATGKDSDYKGMEIDMVREVAKRLGMETKMENIAFNGVIPAILSKQVDLAATGMTMTKERAQKVAFAAPFYESKLAFVVLTKSTAKSAEDFKGKKIAAMVGTTGAKYGESHGMSVKQFDNSSEAILEMETGNADAAIVDKPVAEYYAALEGKGKGKVRVITIADSKSELLGFVMNKDNKELKDKVNKALADMKKDGTYNKIYQKWFNVDAPSLPESAEKA
jgi:polar amino acid transport system substrate-binding protein